MCVFVCYRKEAREKERERERDILRSGLQGQDLVPTPDFAAALPKGDRQGLVNTSLAIIGYEPYKHPQVV